MAQVYNYNSAVKEWESFLKKYVKKGKKFGVIKEVNSTESNASPTVMDFVFSREINKKFEKIKSAYMASPSDTISVNTPTDQINNIMHMLGRVSNEIKAWEKNPSNYSKEAHKYFLGLREIYNKHFKGKTKFSKKEFCKTYNSYYKETRLTQLNEQLAETAYKNDKEYQRYQQSDNPTATPGKVKKALDFLVDGVGTGLGMIGDAFLGLKEGAKMYKDAFKKAATFQSPLLKAINGGPAPDYIMAKVYADIAKSLEKINNDIMNNSYDPNSSITPQPIQQQEQQTQQPINPNPDPQPAPSPQPYTPNAFQQNPSSNFYNQYKQTQQTQYGQSQDILHGSTYKVDVNNFEPYYNAETYEVKPEVQPTSNFTHIPYVTDDDIKRMEDKQQLQFLVDDAISRNKEEWKKFKSENVKKYSTPEELREAFYKHPEMQKKFRTQERIAEVVEKSKQPNAKPIVIVADDSALFDENEKSAGIDGKKEIERFGKKVKTTTSPKKGKQILEVGGHKFEKKGTVVVGFEEVPDSKWSGGLYRPIERVYYENPKNPGVFILGNEYVNGGATKSRVEKEVIEKGGFNFVSGSGRKEVTYKTIEINKNTTSINPIDIVTIDDLIYKETPSLLTKVESFEELQTEIEDKRRAIAKTLADAKEAKPEQKVSIEQLESQLQKETLSTSRISRIENEAQKFVSEQSSENIEIAKEEIEEEEIEEEEIEKETVDEIKEKPEINLNELKTNLQYADDYALDEKQKNRKLSKLSELIVKMQVNSNKKKAERQAMKQAKIKENSTVFQKGNTNKMGIFGKGISSKDKTPILPDGIESMAYNCMWEYVCGKANGKVTDESLKKVIDTAVNGVDKKDENVTKQEISNGLRELFIEEAEEIMAGKKGLPRDTKSSNSLESDSSTKAQIDYDKLYNNLLQQCKALGIQERDMNSEMSQRMTILTYADKKIKMLSNIYTAQGLARAKLYTMERLHKEGVKPSKFGDILSQEGLDLNEQAGYFVDAVRKQVELQISNTVDPSKLIESTKPVRTTITEQGGLEMQQSVSESDIVLMRGEDGKKISCKRTTINGFDVYYDQDGKVVASGNLTQTKEAVKAPNQIKYDTIIANVNKARNEKITAISLGMGL